jgi:zeaxanthin glucosyltransferase
MNGSMKLAKALKGRGHRVCFLGIPDCREQVHSNGLEFIPIFEKWFPPGSLFEAEVRLSRLSGLRRLIAQFQHTRHYLSLVGSLLRKDNKEFYDIIRSLRPDLFLIGAGDIFPSFVAIMAYQTGTPSIYLTLDVDALPHNKERRRRGAGQRPVALQARGVRKKISEILGLRPDWEGITERLALAYGVPPEKLDLNPHFPCPMKLPHLVLTPKEFDLPQSEKRGDCYFAEASIDLSRKEVPFPWEKLTDEKPLVFCSLGTMHPLGKQKTREFFQILIDAFAIKEKYQAVLSIGRYHSADEFTAVPPNVIIVNHAPQLALLRKTAMMITSAGGSTSKECILFGVPMIVFPFSNHSQMAVAARISYHKLGLISDFKKASVGQMISLIDKLELDREVPRRVNKMSETFRALEISERAVAYIEGLLKQGDHFGGGESRRASNAGAISK